jgi:uncharacterized protein YkwD
MSTLQHAKSVIATCIAAWALVACGWHDPVADSGSGGNGGSTGFSGQDASAPTLTNNIAVDGRAWLNYRRSQIGLSTLAEDVTVDRVAQGHSDYQRLNGTVTHDQKRGQPGFTGVTLEDRFKAAGYNFGTTNAIGEVIAATQDQNGFYMAEQLITAIYHRFVIFEPVFQQVGTGSAANAGYAYFTADFVTNNGYGTGLPSTALASWPIDGQTGVPINFLSDSEEPDPVPDVNLVGYPISVHTNLTRKLTVQSFTVRARSGGANLQTRLLTKDLDPVNTTSQSVAAIIPLAPLAADTRYDVTFSGAIDGAAVSKTWSFTTAK